MNYDETVKEIEGTFGTIPGFMKDAPQDILIQMWPLFKKCQMGESIIPPKYREMMMLAAAALQNVHIVRHIIRRSARCWAPLTRN